MAGKVYLIGAGPGDPGLVTVKGLELIQKADCIVYDRLSAPELLSIRFHRKKSMSFWSQRQRNMPAWSV